MARALRLEGYRHVLDIGGGSGVYASSIVVAHEHVRATVLEKPPVDAIARRDVAARGLSERVVTIAGDMGFVVCSEELPSGRLVATNIFVREGGTWKICHHHASPVARHIAVASTPPGELN